MSKLWAHLGPDLRMTSGAECPGAAVYSTCYTTLGKSARAFTPILKTVLRGEPTKPDVPSAPRLENFQLEIRESQVPRLTRMDEVKRATLLRNYYEITLEALERRQCTIFQWRKAYSRSLPH
jgi:hypothetical protein